MKKIDKELFSTLYSAALGARACAYTPYSNHPVGVALLAKSGAIYSGCNVENAAYPLGFCGEANAIGHMVRAGDREITHVLLSGPGFEPCMPCGGCRQQLREFASAQGVGVTVCDRDGKILHETTLEALLPHSFGPDNVAEMKQDTGSTL